MSLPEPWGAVAGIAGWRVAAEDEKMGARETSRVLEIGLVPGSSVAIIERSLWQVVVNRRFTLVPKPKGESGI